MARSRKVNYFAQISSDEDFDELLQKKGLIILDVYQESFGPCAISLHGALEKAKISLTDSDKLQLAVCDVDKVEKLKRFRQKSIPTIVFCGEGKVIDVVYGANVPLLLQTVSTQLQLLDLANGGEETRTFYEFDEPVEWERADLDRIQAEKEEAERVLREQIEAEEKKEMDEMIDLMTENASDMGVTIFMPHVIDVAVRKTATNARRLFLNARTRKMVQVTSDLLTTLEKTLDEPLSDGIKKYLQGKEVMVVLWNLDPGTIAENELAKFVRQVTEVTKVYDDYDTEGEQIEARILDDLTVYFDENGEVIPDTSNETTLEEVEEMLRTSTIDYRKSIRSEKSADDEDDQRPKIVVCPVWTPDNKPCTCLIMFTLFRNQFEHFLPPVVLPDPPHICMIFPASKHKEIFKLSQDYQKELLAFGFFTSSNLNNCELICKTKEKYEKLGSKDTESIILKVAKKTSLFSLALTSVSPIYVSHNTEKGAEECAKIFDEKFYEATDEDEEEPGKQTQDS